MRMGTNVDVSGFRVDEALLGDVRGDSSSFDDALLSDGQPESPATSVLRRDHSEQSACSILTNHWFIFFIVFIASTAFAIILPSVWPYLQQLDIPLGYLGAVVAMYSVGQLIASPVFGHLTSKLTMSNVLHFSFFLWICGSLFYVLVPFARTRFLRVAGLMVGRFLQGCASGNVTVARAYMVRVSRTRRETTVSLALITGIQCFGFILGPGLASVFSLVSYRNGDWIVNANTLPAYFTGVLAVVCVAVLTYLHKADSAIQRHDDDLVHVTTLHRTGKSAMVPTRSPSAYMLFDNPREHSNVTSPRLGSKDSTQTQHVTSRRELMGFALCIMCVFSISLSFTIFETVVVPYTQAAYNWNTRHNGVLFAVLGVVSYLVQTALVIKRDIQDSSLVTFGVVLQVVAVVGFCNLHSDGYVSLPRFLASAGLLTMGYSISYALIYPVFSQLDSEKDRQGTKMGGMTSSASLARILGPLVIAPLFHFRHGFYIFVPIAALLFMFVFIPMIVFRDYLRPV